MGDYIPSAVYCHTFDRDGTMGMAAICLPHGDTSADTKHDLLVSQCDSRELDVRSNFELDLLTRH